jgi:hypothetical protein
LSSKIGLLAKTGGSNVLAKIFGENEHEHMNMNSYEHVLALTTLGGTTQIWIVYIGEVCK